MSSNKKKILVAEDEKPLGKAMELKLTSAGYDVKWALNGEEALDLVKSDKFDLIILDLMMPKRDGFTVLTEMKKNNISTPVIVTSNLSQEEDMKAAKDLGAREYFVKSDTPLFELVKHINTILQDS